MKLTDWLTPLEGMAECEGCGTTLGPAEHKPGRWCGDCRPDPLWAEPQDHVRAADGRVGVVLEPGEDLLVAVSGRLERWPLEGSRMIR